MLREQSRRRAEFHGRTLAELYNEHLRSTGLSKVVFTFETTRHARKRAALTAFFDTLFHEVAPRARISVPAVYRSLKLANDRRVARCFAARSYWLVRSLTRALGAEKPAIADYLNGREQNQANRRQRR